jgi:shikimate dehydrogenase
MARAHFAVLGDPIEHSLSPKIHAAAYQTLGLDWDYTRFQVAKGSLEYFVQSEGKHLTGMSITMPLKNEASAIATKRDPIVELTRVANTLVRTETGFSAFNTDVYGVRQALTACFANPVGQVAILGAGATAISALVAISQNAPDAQITVYVRDVTKADAILDLAKGLGLGLEVAALAGYDSNKDLTISTVPNDVLASLSNEKSAGWLLNANYSSVESSFTASFDKDRRVDGRTMLLWQALAQIRIFVSGDPELPLPNEARIFDSMSNAL